MKNARSENASWARFPNDFRICIISTRDSVKRIAVYIETHHELSVGPTILKKDVFLILDFPPGLNSLFSGLFTVVYIEISVGWHVSSLQYLTLTTRHSSRHSTVKIISSTQRSLNTNRDCNCILCYSVIWNLTNCETKNGTFSAMYLLNSGEPCGLPEQ